MWRTIASRSSIPKHLRRKLLSSQNPLSPTSKVPLHKTLNPSSCTTSHLGHPTKPPHQNHRFFSNSSSIDDFKTDAHDATSSSSKGLELENVPNCVGFSDYETTHDAKSSQEHGLSTDFAVISENNDAHVSSFGSIDQGLGLGGNGVGFSDQTRDDKSSQELELSPDLDGISENIDAHLSSFSSIDLDLGLGKNGVGFSDETRDVKSSQELELTSEFDGIDENVDARMSSFSSVDQGLEGVDVGKLENLLSLLQSSLDESLECKLDSMGLCLNEEFVVRVIETPLVLGDNLIRFFKWGLSKNGFSMTTAILGSLTRAICDNPKRKDAYALWDLVKEIDEKEKGVVNAESLNRLISAFLRLGKGKAAFEVFGKFGELGCVPNSDTYYLTIEALCRRSFYEWAMLVCQKMLDAGGLPENEKVGEIISLFCKGRREKEAHIVYLVAKQQNKFPPQRSVDFLISCLSKIDKTVHLAQEMLVDFSCEDRKDAINPFSWVVRGLCRKKDVEGAKGLLLEMIGKGPSPGNAVFNSVINCLSKSGDLEDAKEVMKLMESRGLKPDVYTYSVIMSGYAKGGLMEEACKVLTEAKKNHQKLCPVTFHTLIRGYCKLGEFNKALNLMSEMKNYGVEVNVDEYNKMIQTLCLKALDWETAEKLQEEMNEKGLHLPGITRGLIKAVKELELEAVESEEVVA